MLFYLLMFVIISLKLAMDLCYYGSKHYGMFNVILIVLLLTQGIIHFAVFYKLTYSKQAKKLNSGNSHCLNRRPLLILASFLFFITAILFVQTDMIWIVAATCTVLFSQYLIIINWRNMWYGSFINILIFIGIVFSYTSWKLEKFIDEKINFMYASHTSYPVRITSEMINAQPENVKKWLLRAKVLDRNMSESISLRQTGEMRTSPSGKWMKVKAREYFTTTKPAFLWTAEVDGGSFMKFRGLDHYRNGKGHMQIQWFSVFPVVNSSGKEIDQGCMLRYLAEIVWFPSCALKPYIQWQQLDSIHAKATMNYGRVKASGIFTFNSLGDVVRFEAKRYYNRQEGATLEDWLINIDDGSYKEFEGIRVPTQASITWKLESGAFNWFNIKVQDIQYRP